MGVREPPPETWTRNKNGGFCIMINNIDYQNLIHIIMKGHIFTQEERDILLQNKNIAKVTNHSVSFTPKFKEFAVAEHAEKGRRPQDIFITEGIPVAIIGLKIPERCVSAWRRKVHDRGWQALGEDGRGRRKGSGERKKKMRIDESTMSDKDLIAYYKAKVAYTEAENDFLARTRGIPRMAQFVYHLGLDTDS